MPVITISSPVFTVLPPKLLATRLMLSVVLRVKMISCMLAAFRKARTFLPRAFVGGGRAFRQQVDAAMNIGVVRAVTLADGVNDRFRSLRRGRVIQIDQRFAVDPLTQDRKLGADAGEVQPGAGGRRNGKSGRGAHVVIIPR